jgi:two-component system, cell cycle sensor histidine kinase and response regulator CckA
MKQKRQVQQWISVTDASLKIIMDASPVGIVVFDHEAQVIYANHLAQQIFDKTDERVVPSKCGDFLACPHSNTASQGCGHTDHCPSCPFFRAIGAAVGEKEANAADLEGEALLIREPLSPDLWVKFKANDIVIDGHKAAVMAIDDITEQKWRSSDCIIPPQTVDNTILHTGVMDEQLLVAQDLAEDEHYLRTILQTTADGFWVIDVLSRKIIEVNQAYCKMSGYSRDELLQLAIADLEAIETPEDTRARIQNIITKGFLTFETYHRRRDGSIFNVEISVHYLNIKGGQLICFCRDISERKIMADALRQSEEKYRRIYENALVGIFQSTPEGQFLEVNPSFATMLGYSSPAEFIASISDIKTQYYAAAEDRQRYQNIMQEKGFIQNFEFKVKSKSGFHVWVSNSSRALVGQDGNIVRYEGVVLDITKRQVAVEELKKERQQLAYIIEGTNVGTWEWNVRTGETIFNERWAEMIGYTLDELLPVSIDTWKRFAHPDDLKKSEELLTKHFAGQLDYYEFESRMRHKDGSWVWVLDRGRVSQWDEDRQPVLMSGTHQDINTRKLAEQALKESEHRFRSFIENANDIVYAVSPEGLFTYISPNWIEVMGEPAQMAVGKSFEVYVHPEDVHACRTFLETVLATGKKQSSVEYRVKHRDGTWRWHVSNGSPLRDLDDSIFGYLGIARDVTERKQAEEALLESEANFSKAFISNPAPLVIEEVDTGRTINVNDRWVQLIGYTREELIGRTSGELGIWADIESRKSLIKKLKEKGHIKDEPVEFRTKSGDKVQALWSVELIKIAGRQFILGMMYDLIERIKSEQEKETLQRQLFQSQKMESVGRLAGGVAHDFNNMLSVILGHTEMALEQVAADDPLFDDLQEINKSARRSADLTRQLLAFARKQTAAPKILDLNATVDDMLRMLRRLIGEQIQLVWQPGSDLWSVKMDPSQLDQILANLCVNARDAIAGMGTITIAAENVTLDGVLLDEPDTPISGDYVRLSVMDDGCGMDQQTLVNIFEPFFTTKPLGEGTGLGLSTVFGIAKQNAGFVQVQSAPGQGTTFILYLPRYVMQEVQPATPVSTPSRVHGSILVVEDEPSILSMTVQMLERQGYTALGAATPGEALRFAREHAGDIDLLMTDVIMTEMHGRDLAKKMLALYPGIKCLFMSGYTADVIAEHGMLEEGFNFIQKPFSMKDLGDKIRSVLDDQ